MDRTRVTIKPEREQLTSPEVALDQIWEITKSGLVLLPQGGFGC